MATLPQLIEEDIHFIEQVLRELLEKTEATTALVIDHGGFLICSQGDTSQFDLTTLAALASGAYLASQTIANLVHETSFNSAYQQGENFSMFISYIDEHCLLAVIFKAMVSVGVVKYFAAPATSQISSQLQAARRREPGASIDLSELNVADTTGIFRKRS
jgi:predicted regulator of Ras-like GTPase activity (Roadblock/LC7/MglB family)